MREFKIGDRVKCIGGYEGAIGKKGTVMSYAKQTNPRILVEFDENVNGHDGNGKSDYTGKNGHCWYFENKDLELIPKFKVGDRVRIQGVPAKEEHRAKYNGLVTTIKHINPNGEKTYGEPHYSVSKDGCVFIFKESELVPVNEKKIVITTDGKTTVARLFDGGKVIKEAKADCSPEDKFDFVQGAKLAFERLTHVFKFEVGKMYANYDNSVIIRITSAERKSHDNRYKFEYVKGAHCFSFFDEQSVFAETFKPYEPPKVYNGKVVCIKSHYSWWTVGKVYEVVDGVITDNVGETYPKQTLQPYADAEDVRHAGNLNEDSRHNKYNEFIPLVE